MFCGVKSRAGLILYLEMTYYKSQAPRLFSGSTVLRCLSDVLLRHFRRCETWKRCSLGAIRYSLASHHDPTTYSGDNPRRQALCWCCPVQLQSAQNIQCFHDPAVQRLGHCVDLGQRRSGHQSCRAVSHSQCCGNPDDQRKIEQSTTS